MNVRPIVLYIEKRIAELQRAKDALQNLGRKTYTTRNSKRPKRVISAAGRRAIAAAQRARWARQKKVK